MQRENKMESMARQGTQTKGSMTTRRHVRPAALAAAGLALALALPAAVLAASGETASGTRLVVAYDETNGGVKSIGLASDTNGMNWAEGTGT